MLFPLNDRRLWGNEAADDEDPSVLNSYFVTQPEWHEFFHLDVWPYSIARAKKGMGKSALLAECAFRLNQNNSSLVISIKGSDLVAQKEFKATTPAEQIYDWQQRICALINRHIGSRIGIAFNDDSITLVEYAEISGFKERNILGALIDRLKGKLGPVELQKLTAVDSVKLLGRKLEDDALNVCILIDDIDATYTDTPTENYRLSTFFTACRELASDHKGISIRTVVRSDVWASIRKTDEALDKVEQYIFDIHWGQSAFRKLLIGRVVSYCKRIGQPELTKGKKKDQILSLVFKPRFPWGRGMAPPERIIQVYSGGRPRWAAHLCRMAGTEAMRVSSAHVITFGNIRQVLVQFGRMRIDDISREHRHQCPMISEVVNAFNGNSSTYTTNELLTFISEKIVSNIDISIDGANKNDPLQVARYLFRTGFIIAMDDRGAQESIEYYHFQDNPDLLRSKVNLDNGMLWHIHPSYHGVLGLTFERRI